MGSPSITDSDAQARDTCHRAAALLGARRTDEAARLVEELMAATPASVEARLLAGRVEQQRGRFAAMRARTAEALALAPQDLNAQLQAIESDIYCGNTLEAIAALRPLEDGAGDDPVRWARIAEFRTHLAQHESANRCYRRAVTLEPDHAPYLFNLASSEIALGRLDEAARLLARLIAIDPNDYDAYQLRATLERQTAERNHVAELLSVIERSERSRGRAGVVQLGYALAKEYEDLGEHARAFAFLERGARQRRTQMAYRVEHDVEVMERLAAVFTAELFERAKAGHDDEGPIFVMGLPRSGTSLVDRILSSHADVQSLGEINDFAFALLNGLGTGGGKVELVERSVGLDFRSLGAAYCRSARGYGVSRRFFIDKTPLNFLYLGLIHLALPHARIVHLVRDPMDSCFAMYKTLFRMGYPFSYALEDLARYYVAYRRLMDHWRTVIPRAFLDVRYEDLVDSQEATTRALLEYCGLAWDPACLQFHENASAIATASSVQVRRPLYRDALQRWRQYARELEPLRSALAQAGLLP